MELDELQNNGNHDRIREIRMCMTDTTVNSILVKENFRTSDIIKLQLVKEAPLTGGKFNHSATWGIGAGGFMFSSTKHSK